MGDVKNDLEYKVKINNKDLVSLSMLEFDKRSLTAKDIKSKRPVAYHQFYYDTKKNQYNSIRNSNYNGNKKNEEELTLIKHQYLYSSNLKFKHETGWEMCYIGRENHGRAITIWSWEFDSRLEITNLFINMLFMTFDSNSIVDWYISSKENDILLNKKITDSNEIYSLIVNQPWNFTLLPLNLPNSPVHFEKKLDLSDYFKVNNNINSNTTQTRFYLACIMDKNKNDRIQLFRCKSSNYFNKYGNSNPNPNQHPDPIYNYPFSVYFTLSQKSSITDQLIGDDEYDYNYSNNNNYNTSNCEEECKEFNKFNQLNNFYYFNEEDESINNIRKLKFSKIHKWSNERVLQWLFDIQLYSLIMLFKELRIDGIKLLTFQIELLPITFTENQEEKSKFIKELSKLILISGQKNELQLSKSIEQKNIEYSKFRHQYCLNKSTILSLKSNLLQKKQLIRGNRMNSDNENNNNYRNRGNEEEIKLLNDENTFNFKFIIENKILKVHKEVLIKSSEYFKTILTSDTFKETSERIINFQVDDELTFNSLRIVLELIYMKTKDIQLEFLKVLDLNQLKSTLILSDRFLLVDSGCKLSQLIENYIIWTIDSKNINIIHGLFSFNLKILNYTNFSLQYLK
ncbi:hypothetical protein RB653_007034 [Dictyostelium firmibasis]|uniref:BTB domain-containing protein n=1 Tax=Dictyostelium firmibasis TaxID=79012 RepID=A0AAN7YLQ5_9MYCE